MADYDAMSEIWSNWNDKSRWAETKRPYAAADVLRLRGSLQIEYTLARKGAWRLWSLFQSQPYVAALGATTGNQAIEQVRAGLSAIYASGWQAAADGNQASEMYPHESLSPSLTAFLTWYETSTNRCSAQIRSTMPRAKPTSTGLRRSWRMRNRVSAAASIPLS